jgi:hypothetical protein
MKIKKLKWRPTSTAPKDGNTFLVLQWGWEPAFCYYQRQNKRLGHKRWVIIASQHGEYQVDDLETCPQQITLWMHIPPIPNQDYSGLEDLVKINLKLNRRS